MSLVHPRVAAPPPPREVPVRPVQPAGPACLPPAGAGPGPAAAFAVERLDAGAAAAHRDAWVDLAGRALEPNAFLDPDFALPAAQHLAMGRRPCFALVWAEEGGRRRLVGVCPIVRPRWPLRALASAWLHDLSTLGFPLLDRACAPSALRALLDAAARDLPGAAGLLVPSLPAGGPTAAALRAAAAAGAFEVAVLCAWERAALRRGSARAGLSPKSAKEARRQRRRLGERGALAFRSAAEGDGLRSAVESFLALEAAGWKGAAGTALLCATSRAAFARTATRLLARRGLCRVDGLTLDGEPVALAVVLTAGDADFLWKIAYREDVARFSPGVQLVLEITEAQRVAGRAAMTDSCAVQDHAMIERLWRDRIALEDVAVSLRPGRSARFGAALAAERAARALRAGAKRLVRAWRSRRRPPARP